MGACTCTSKMLIGASAILFMITGLLVSGLSISAMAIRWVRELVPLWTAGIGLAIGLLVLGFSIFGFKSMCDPKKKCTLGIYTIFSLLIAVLVTIVCTFLFLTDSAIYQSEIKNFVNVTGLELTAAQQLKTGVDHVWTVCDADVKPDPAVADAFDFTCNNTEMGPISSAIQNQCFASAINGTMDSEYYDCFISDSWWTPPTMVYSLAATIDTEKGLFCACYTSLIDVLKPYFNIGKWVSIGVTVYFWLVFIGCLFLCCCARTGSEDAYAKSSSNFWARP